MLRRGYGIVVLLVIVSMAGICGCRDAQRRTELAQAALNIKKAKAAVEDARFKEAEPLAKEALAIRERFLEDGDAKAEAIGIYGFVEESLGNYANAESL